MKILHVVRGLNQSSGTTHAILPMAEEQARRGNDVWLYHVRKPAGVLEAAPDPALVKTRAFDLSLPFDHPGFSTDFARTVSRDIGRFDVVHIQAVRNFATWWTMRCAAGAGVPFIVAPQGSYEDWNLGRRSVRNRLYDRFVEIPLLNRAARVHCLTPREVEQVRAMGVTAECVVIPNGVLVDGALPGPGLEPNPKRNAYKKTDGLRRLLFLGRIHPKKGLDLLLPAFAQAAEKLLDLRLVIAGSDNGSGELVKTIAAAEALFPGRVDSSSARPTPASARRHGAAISEENRAPARIVFLGEVRGRAKEACFALADAFILPSYSEGLPVAVLEALAHGLPTIVTDSCNLPEIAREGAGVQADTTPEGVADAILRLFADSAALASCAEKARCLAMEQFSWPRIVDRLLALYGDLA